jgi:hypothetical protein
MTVIKHFSTVNSFRLDENILCAARSSSKPPLMRSPFGDRR